MSNETKLCVVRNAVKGGVTITGVFTWRGKSWRTAELVDVVRVLPRDISDRDLQDAYNEALQSKKSPAAWNRKMALAFCKWNDRNGDFDELKACDLRSIVMMWLAEDGQESHDNAVKLFLDRRMVETTNDVLLRTGSPLAVQS